MMSSGHILFRNGHYTKEKAVAAIHDAREQMQEVLGKVKEQIHGATVSFSEGLDKAAKGLSENAARITETTTSYRDALAQGPRQPS